MEKEFIKQSQSIGEAAINRLRDFASPAKALEELKTSADNHGIGFNGIALDRDKQEAQNEFIKRYLREARGVFTRNMEEESAAAERRQCQSMTRIFERNQIETIRKFPLAGYAPHENIMFLPPTPTYYDVHSMRYIEAHELTHWTGHASRLNRLPNEDDKDIQHFSKMQVAAFGIAEETVAETGAYLFLRQFAPDTFEIVNSHILERITHYVAQLFPIVCAMQAAKMANDLGMPDRLAQLAGVEIASEAMEKGTWCFARPVNEMVMQLFAASAQQGGRGAAMLATHARGDA